MKSALYLCAALLVGCAELPRDPDGTLDRVRAEGEFRVGIIASGGRGLKTGRGQLLIDAVATAARARPVPITGAAEPLLMDLERGRLDLVIGEFSPDNPWQKRVTILPPLASAQVGGRRADLTAAARNGENAWIMLLERAARRAHLN